MDKKPVEDLLEFIKILMKGTRDQALMYHLRPEDEKGIIDVDILEYSGKDFNYSQDDIEILIKQGEKAANEYYEKL